MWSAHDILQAHQDRAYAHVLLVFPTTESCYVHHATICYFLWQFPMGSPTVNLRHRSFQSSFFVNNLFYVSGYIRVCVCKVTSFSLLLVSLCFFSFFTPKPRPPSRAADCVSLYAFTQSCTCPNTAAHCMWDALVFLHSLTSPKLQCVLQS